MSRFPPDALVRAENADEENQRSGTPTQNPKVIINKLWHIQSQLRQDGFWLKYHGASLQSVASMEQWLFQTAEAAKCRSLTGNEVNFAFLPADGLSTIYMAAAPPSHFCGNPAEFHQACPRCLLPGLRVQDSMPTPHGLMPPGNRAHGHGLASGKACLLD